MSVITLCQGRLFRVFVDDQLSSSGRSSPSRDCHRRMVPGQLPRSTTKDRMWLSLKSNGATICPGIVV